MIIFKFLQIYVTLEGKLNRCVIKFKRSLKNFSFLNNTKGNINYLVHKRNKSF